MVTVLLEMAKDCKWNITEVIFSFDLTCQYNYYKWKNAHQIYIIKNVNYIASNNGIHNLFLQRSSLKILYRITVVISDVPSGKHFMMCWTSVTCLFCQLTKKRTYASKWSVIDFNSANRHVHTQTCIHYFMFTLRTKKESKK